MQKYKTFGNTKELFVLILYVLMFAEVFLVCINPARAMALPRVSYSPGSSLDSPSIQIARAPAATELVAERSRSQVEAPHARRLHFVTAFHGVWEFHRVKPLRETPKLRETSRNLKKRRAYYRRQL